MTVRALTFSRTTDTVRLPVKGQGVLLFRSETPCTLTFHSATVPVLSVVFDLSGIHVQHNEETFVDPKNTQGLISTAGARYWFSLDAQNQALFAGIGEARRETTTYQYTLSHDAKQWMEAITHIHLQKAIPLRLLRDPITRKVPLQIRDTHALTMDDVANGTFLPVANLNPTAQKLYNCIAGRNFQLDTRDFPDFAKAIGYSIETPSCWCFETLKAKSHEFGPNNPMETYLRITLNENNGESPGIPYVMEIWPAGHYSPVHNHGGSHAIIRVLHGSIHVRLFSFLGGESFGSADFHRGEITWLSPTLNQIHQLENRGTEACITIQCYMYDGEDSKHYDYFDYLEGDTVQQFEPNSDMDFVGFKETIRKEWLARSRVTSSDLKHDTTHSSPTANAVGESHNLTSFSCLARSMQRGKLYRLRKRILQFLKFE